MPNNKLSNKHMNQNIDLKTPLMAHRPNKISILLTILLSSNIMFTRHAIFAFKKHPSEC